MGPVVVIQYEGESTYDEDPQGDDVDNVVDDDYADDYDDDDDDEDVYTTMYIRPWNNNRGTQHGPI